MHMLVTCRFLTRITSQLNPVIIANRSKLPSVVLPKKYSKMAVNGDDPAFQNQLKRYFKELPPSLEAGGNHKGQAGKIGILGGSFEYTGAPYFAGITALRVGADLVHIFCQKDAANPIKSYSPELIVHPLIDPVNCGSKQLGEIKEWINRMNTVVIGPGLGRDEAVLDIAKELILHIKETRIPLIIDADGLFLVASYPDLLKGFNSTVILTPNKAELQRLTRSPSSMTMRDPVVGVLKDNGWGKSVVILAKGKDDVVITMDRNLVFKDLGGSNRRCGGQGDILAGSLAVFLNWSNVLKENNVFVACLAACKLVRDCNAAAFAKKGRSMISTDMIEEIHDVFEKSFEH